MKTAEQITDTKQAPVKYNAYGCTIATGENWLDGKNYGGNFVATTFDPDLQVNDLVVPTDEAIDRATAIAHKLTVFPELIAALHEAKALLRQAQWLICDGGDDHLGEQAKYHRVVGAINAAITAATH